MLPVRCFTCNKILGRYDLVLQDFHSRYPGPDKPWRFFFDEMNITRYCCRKILVTHIDTFADSVCFDVENVTSKKELEVELLLPTK